MTPSSGARPTSELFKDLQLEEVPDGLAIVRRTGQFHDGPQGVIVSYRILQNVSWQAWFIRADNYLSTAQLNTLLAGLPADYLVFDIAHSHLGEVTIELHPGWDGDDS